jgi:hypothetical protein
MSGIWLGLLLLCSCATRDSTRPELPGEAALNQDAGRGGYVRLKLHLEGGEELDCKLDTGSPWTILNNALEPKLGERVGQDFTDGMRGLRTNGIYLAPRLYLGDTPMVTYPVILTDQMEKGTAILGLDCLKNYCLQMDFAANKIRFLDPDHLDTNGLGRAFPLVFSDQHIIVHEAFMGVKKWVIDTGAPVDGAVSGHDFDRVARGRQPATVSDGVNVTRGACLPEGGFGGGTYSDLVLRELPHRFTDGPNILGLNFLARNLVTFNFPKRMMYLKQVTAGPLNPADVITLEADAFLEDLRQKGRLPGWSKAGEPLDWVFETGDSAVHPVSRTLKFQIGCWIDVTSKIKLLAAGGQARISVNNNLAARDPAPSVVKQLRIDFRRHGRSQTAEAAEGETLTLPAGAEVVTAFYGNLHGHIPGRQVGDLTAYHCTVCRESKGSPWKVQKAWRTDADGRSVEEYPIR